jgi:hypothetical protein
MGNNQHWTRRAAQDPFGNATDCDMSQSTSAMRSHDDKVHIVFLRIAADFAVGHASYHSSFDTKLYYDMRLELLVQSLFSMSQTIGHRLRAGHKPRISHNMQQVQTSV